ncbi:hypothetical protein [Urechidicola croceus]|uniref:Uncharacterized protein n=1 Tax=Urechidicola croceus TaxID=1850246 RepID=A0A1D8PA22_9FLAO|nr:hypothetical protein [Urechidicola croceus]AOW21405.1 hypothetical protein LPB138_12265 [Urechidicola croceus]
MAPLKYEENMRDKLEKRTIQPSANAWEKLSKRLDDSEDKKSKKSIFWFVGIAASIIGVLWISASLLFSEKFVPIEPQIVDTPKIEVKEENKEDIIIESSQEYITEIQKEPQETTEPIIAENSIIEQKSTTINKEDILIDNTIIEQSFVAEVIDEVENQKVSESFNLKAVEEENVDAIVAQIVELKEQNQEITDAEIDELLNEAQDKIRLKKLYKNNSKTIDAMALLQDVEADIDRSFRMKVFEALKINYNSVKTAVAQRND